MKESGLRTVFINLRVTIISGIILFIINLGFIFGPEGSEWYMPLYSFLEYDRHLIINGEIWRLFTCHLVHWSPAHFYLDCIVFIFQGITFEQKTGDRYLISLIISALFISVAIFTLRDDLIYYRGISGLINTQLVLGAGIFIFDSTLSKKIRVMFVICFAIHLVKIVYETINRAPLFSTNLLGDMGLFTPVAHLSGVVMGLIFLTFYLMSFSGKRSEGIMT